MRQLVDAGTLSNLPGGLKARGLRIKGDDTPISPGEFRDVDLGSGNIRDNILPLPYKEPSMVLSGLMDKIVEEGRRFAATSDMKIADMSNQAPVGTTLAILERTLKVMSAVQARVHYSMKQELHLLLRLSETTQMTNYTYEPEDGTAVLRRRTIAMLKCFPYQTQMLLPFPKESFNTKRSFNWRRWLHRFTICQFYIVRCWKCLVLSMRVSWCRWKKTRNRKTQ
jgi:hypothetical protein